MNIKSIIIAIIAIMIVGSAYFIGTRHSQKGEGFVPQQKQEKGLPAENTPTEKNPITKKDANQNAAKNNETAQQPVPEKNTPSAKGMAVAFLKDQFGQPISGLSMQLRSDRGNFSCTKSEKSTPTGSVATCEVEQGEYELKIAGCTSYDDYSRKINISEKEVSLGTIIIHRRSIVRGYAVNPDGSPVTSANYTITDHEGKISGDWSCNFEMMGGISPNPGYFVSSEIANGDYNFKIRRIGQSKENGRLVTYGFEKTITATGELVDLGTIKLYPLAD